MVKVKLFGDYSLEQLDRDVNEFFASHRQSDIIDVQYKVDGRAHYTYSVCITYRDDS